MSARGRRDGAAGADDPSASDVDAYATPLEVLALVPRSIAVEHAVFPIAVDPDGRLVLASNDVLTNVALERLEAALARPVEVRLATRGSVAFAIRRGYARLEAEAGAVPGARAELVGKRLIARRLVTEGQVEEALRQQRRAYARLGDILVEQGSITSDALERAVAEFLTRSGGERLGDFLVSRGDVAAADVTRALEEQRRRSPKLGELLVALGFVRELPDDE